MTNQRTHHLQLAHAVLDWNRRHLNRDSVLTEALIGECFAEHFIVEPNGRRYEANPANYLEFLNGMKAGMEGIDYEIDHALVDGTSVTFSMRARISYADGRRELFRAMLLMWFNDAGKVTLWHEVYVPIALPS
ncbi:nuclear transport factor 2 family protein [uncultured Stenotrophomonas sp.]|uniref:nuclear transport factor 2 family protein n=1 Tax=uncultured Stenotrophomonas sp. TaxID=165438 RepID=UPI0025D88D4B|nr:nuclear transport factor 2 family protein [uncultured Stenotrophomonas sp.]